MPTGTGLDAQLGVAEETVYGTGVTASRFVEFLNESMKFEPTWLDSGGLRPGIKYRRAARSRISRRNVTGDLSFELATKGMGLFWRHALASAQAAPALIVAGAYRQVHTPGDFLGRSLTAQIGRPEPATGTVRAHTFRGCKVAGWEFSCTDGEIPSLKLTLSGREEVTNVALASASYLAGATVFDFSQAALLLGGTAATAGGVTTITSGAQAGYVVRSITIRGETPMATERFGLGNGGLKSQPLENGIPMITGQLTAEFDSATYAAYLAAAATPLQFRLTGGQIAATGSNFLTEFTMPAIKFKAAAPAVGGPDIVPMTLDFEAYSDETNPVLQVLLQSDEAGY